MEEDKETTSPLVEKIHSFVCVSKADENGSQNSIQGGVHSENRSHDTITHGFRNLFLVLKLCGLFFDKHECSKPRYVCQVTVFLFLFCISWANVIRYMFVYNNGEQFSPELMTKVTFHTCYTFTALTHTALLHLSLKHSPVFTKWQRYHDKHQIPCLPIVQNVKTNTLRILLLSLVTIICMIIGIILERYTDSPFGFYAQMPFTSQDDHFSEVPIGNTAAMALLYTLTGALFGSYLSWFIIVGTALQKEFELLANHYKWKSEEIEMIRLQHFELSSIISDIDTIVSPYILAVFICCVPIACFNLYLLVVWDLSMHYKVFLALTLIAFISVLFTVILVAARINDKVSGRLNVTFYFITILFIAVKKLFGVHSENRSRDTIKHGFRNLLKLCGLI